MKNKIIDFHSHPQFDDTEYPAIAKKLREHGFPHIEKRASGIFLVSKRDDINRPVEKDLIDPKTMLAEMADFGIVHQVKLALPWAFRYELKNKKLALWLAKLTNDKIAEEWVGPYPEKFSGGCTVPMQFPELAIQELRRCAKMGFKIVTIGTTVNQKLLDEQMFNPFWKAACDLGIKIFVHPQEMTGPQDFWFPWTDEMPNRTRVAMVSFLVRGILERFPDLKVIFSHGGTDWFADEGRRQYAYKVRRDLVKNDPNRFVHKIHVGTHTCDAELLALIIKRHGSDILEYEPDSPFALGEWPSAQNPNEKPGTMILNMKFGNKIETKRVQEKLLYKNAERLLERTF